MGNGREAVVAAIAFLFLGAHCGNKPEPDPDPASCADACAHMAELGCEEAEPTPEGATCEQVCRNTEGSGVVTLNPGCVLGIDSCEQVEQCVQTGELGSAGAGGSGG